MLKLFGGASVLLSALLVATAAQAQLYVCIDNKGRTISGDRPPEECVNRPVRELRGDGSVKRVIEPPPTAEQKAARAEEEKRQQLEAERQRENMRRDLALLDAYANEEEIESTRNRALANRQSVVERAQKRLEEHKKEQKKLEQEKEFYAGRELPTQLKRSLETIAALQRSEERVVKEVQADMVRLNEKFDNERKRFQELVKSGAQPRR